VVESNASSFTSKESMGKKGKKQKQAFPACNLTAQRASTSAYSLKTGRSKMAARVDIAVGSVVSIENGISTKFFQSRMASLVGVLEGKGLLDAR
jgi:hypothetical protein